MKHLFAIAALLMLCSAAMAVGSWFISGGRLYDVQTGSMRPLIRPGDMVLVRTGQPTVVGDIVSYRSPGQPEIIISHRIISNDNHHSQLITKGDANPTPDVPISAEQVIGRVVYKAPRLGRVVRWLRSPPGLLCAVYIPAFITIAIIVRNAIKPIGYRLYR